MQSIIGAGLRVFQGAALGAFLVLAFTAATLQQCEPSSTPRPPAEHAPTTVLERHADDCWTGAQPALAAVPGHVIWQAPDGTTTYSHRLVGPALDTLFGDGKLPGTPIAFCR